METNRLSSERSFEYDELLPPASKSAFNGARQLIPKRLIQVFIQWGAPQPPSVKTRAMVANLRLLHPDYDYMFFDSAAVDRFFEEECPEFRAVFDAYTVPVQKCDFFRYLAIYRYGGFYFDLDVMLAEELSPLRDFGCVFPFEGLTLSEYLRDACGMDWEIGNYAFGATAGHPFIRAVIENCVRAQRDPKWGALPIPKRLPLSRAENHILFTSGPGLVSRTYAEHPELAPAVKIMFPEDVCDPAAWHCFGEFGVHLMEGTWRPKNGRLRHRLRMELERIRRRSLVKQSRAMGKLRSFDNSQ